MTEWRRLRESWPVEKARVAERNSLPDWFDPAVRLRDTRGEMLVGTASIMAAFALPLLAALGAIRFFVPDGTGMIAFAFVVAGFASAFALGWAVAGRGEEWSGRRRARRALDRIEARGEPTLGSEAVGVSYAEGRWRADMLGDAWDWGALRLDLDRLVFVGEHSRFELRPQDVVDTEVRRIDPGLGGSQPRLYLRYRTGGSVASIGLDLPYVRSAHRRVEQMVNLKSRINWWHREPLPTPNGLPSLLPSHRDTPVPRASVYGRIGRPAKLLASVVTILTVFIVQMILMVALTLAGVGKAGGYVIPLASLGWVLWIFVAAKIETKLPERWRFKESILPSAGIMGTADATDTGSTSRSEIDLRV